MRLVVLHERYERREWLCKLDSPVRSIVTSPDVTEVLAGDEMGRITRLKLPSLEVVTGFETDSPILRLQYIVSCVKGGE